MGIGNLSGNPVGIGQEIFSSSATAAHSVGTLATDNFGRKFRYVKAGAVALVPGKVQQAPAQVTEHDQLTPSAAAIGATQVTVTLGSTAATANQYAGGWIHIDTTPGQGYAYPIEGHPAADASATLTVTLGQPIQVALTTSSRVTLVPNPYNGVIVSPVTTLTGAVVGVGVYPVAIGEYGWIQTGGPCCTLIAGTPGVGLAVVVPGTAAGAVVVDGAASETQVVGSMMVTGVDGKYLPVYLTLD
jgi:phosphohistidine swiveling domain-containing protein